MAGGILREGWGRVKCGLTGRALPRYDGNVIEGKLFACAG